MPDIHPRPRTMTVKSRAKSEGRCEVDRPGYARRGDFIFSAWYSTLPAEKPNQAALAGADSYQQMPRWHLRSGIIISGPDMKPRIMATVRNSQNHGRRRHRHRTATPVVAVRKREDDIVLEWARLNRREARWRKWAKAVHLAKTLKMVAVEKPRRRGGTMKNNSPRIQSV